jgi:hypothetical protein
MPIRLWYFKNLIVDSKIHANPDQADFKPQPMYWLCQNIGYDHTSCNSAPILSEYQDLITRPGFTPALHRYHAGWITRRSINQSAWLASMSVYHILSPIPGAETSRMLWENHANTGARKPHETIHRFTNIALFFTCQIRRNKSKFFLVKCENMNVPVR